MSTVDLIFIITAIILVILAAFNVPFPKNIQPGWLGFAFFLATFIF